MKSVGPVVKDHASFENKWVPKAGPLGVSVGQGRYEGDKGDREQPRPRTQKALIQALLSSRDFTLKTVENH